MAPARHPALRAKPMTAGQKQALLLRIEHAMTLCDQKATPDALSKAASICATPTGPSESPQAPLPLVVK